MKKPGGSISDLQTPTRGNRKTNNPLTSVKKPQGSSRLVSLAQRRQTHKHKNESNFSAKTEELSVANKRKNIRATLGTTMDLKAMREAKKAEKLALTDESREDMLFGDISTIKQDRNTQNIESRKDTNFRNTVNYREEYIPENSMSQSFIEDSDSDIVYDESIDEHDNVEESNPINMQKRESFQKHQKELPAALMRTFMTSVESGLETIKEAEDNATPMKVKKAKIKFEISDGTDGSDDEVIQEEEVKTKTVVKEVKKELKTPTQASAPKKAKFKSKIKRRNTTALKQAINLASSDEEEEENVIIPKALARLRNEPDKSPGATYTTSGANTKKTFTSMLTKNPSNIKKPDTSSKFGFKKGLSPNSPANKALKKPITKKFVKPTSKKPTSDKTPVKKLPAAIKRQPTLQKTPEQKAEEEAKKKADQEERERKRKMMAERKLLLKKKLAAIKVQKFWVARAKRRKLKLDFIRYSSAIRTIQRWYSRIYKDKQVKQKLLDDCQQNHLDKIILIQKNYRRHQT